MERENRLQMGKLEFAWLVLIFLSLLTLFALGVLLLHSAREMLLLIFAGVLFAIFIRGISDFLFGRFHRLPPKIKILLTVLLIFVALAVFIILLAPRLAEQGEKLFSQLPEALNQLRSKVNLNDWPTRLLRVWDDSAKMATGKALGFFATSFGAITSMFIIIFVGLYLSFSPHYYIDGMLRLFPAQTRPRVGQVLQAMGHTLARWLIGRFVGMLLITIFTYLGLLVLDIPLALSLAVLAGLLTFIPNIGPIISALPAILLGFTRSPLTALYVVILYGVVQAVESYLVTPLIQQREAALPPVFTLSAQVVLGSMLGMLGLALATPLTAAVLVLVRMLYIEDVLHE